MTYLSKVFYFLGNLVSIFKWKLTGTIFYPLYRRLMLISIKLDINNIIWENKLNKKSKRADFIALNKYMKIQLGIRGSEDAINHILIKIDDFILMNKDNLFFAGEVKVEIKQGKI